ncbi:MAG: hypothetical protein K8R92_04880 [Planctomycetes bacterium]|nr:hypothetical protein [Planctomycetota bacterium]
MRSLRNTIIGSSITALACALPMACDPATPPPTPSATAASSLPKNLFVMQQPAGAVGVLEARKQAKAGQRVAIIGRIGGSVSPFVSNRAVFTLVDASLKTCAEMGDDAHCPTPADYCCEERSSLAKALASVAIVDRSGKPLAIALDSEGSLKPLMLIAVEGTLQPTEGGVFSVNADHIYKIPNDPLASKIK